MPNPYESPIPDDSDATSIWRHYWDDRKSLATSMFCGLGCCATFSVVYFCCEYYTTDQMRFLGVTRETFRPNVGLAFFLGALALLFSALGLGISAKMWIACPYYMIRIASIMFGVLHLLPAMLFYHPFARWFIKLTYDPGPFF